MAQPRPPNGSVTTMNGGGSTTTLRFGLLTIGVLFLMLQLWNPRLEQALHHVETTAAYSSTNEQPLLLPPKQQQASTTNWTTTTTSTTPSATSAATTTILEPLKKHYTMNRTASEMAHVCKRNKNEKVFETFCYQFFFETLDKILFHHDTDSINDSARDDNDVVHVVQIGAHTAFEGNDPLAVGMKRYFELLPPKLRQERLHWSHPQDQR
jgi:hypothetical protein